MRKTARSPRAPTGSFYTQFAESFTDRLAEVQGDMKRFRKARKSWTRDLAKSYAQVPIEELIDSDEFLGLENQIYPVHRDDIIELWDRRKRFGTWRFLDMEGIGSGKTFKAGIILWLLVYENIILPDPLSHYGLAKDGGIGLICMSRNATLAKQVTFKKIAPFFNCPFFETYFPVQNINWDELDEMQRLPSALYFPKHIGIWPGTGSAMSAIGYDLYGGIIDEACFLEVVSDSARSVEIGGRYDAAEELVNAITKRMASRFLADGRIQGLLVVISSSRYTEDYLERELERNQRNPEVMVRRRALWEAKPAILPSGHRIWSGEMFSIDTDTFQIYDSAGRPISLDDQERYLQLSQEVLDYTDQDVT